jgi:hypothetical protein
MSLMNKLVDKITTGPQAQYILGGALVVIIGLSLASVFLSTMKSNSPTGPSELHAFCLETQQEFVLDPKEMRSEEMMPMDPMDGLVYSPFTKERTAVMMTQCPNCKKWFVPDYLKDALEQRGTSPMMMLPPDMDSALVCPYCKTDIIQWYRDHRKKR